MLVYHGGYVPIEEINLEKCRPYTDFGKGFYVTKFKNQASELFYSSKMFRDIADKETGLYKRDWEEIYKIFSNELV